MSLWLQAACEAFYDRDYRYFREGVLPHAPFPVPDCLIRELEFAECHCGPETDNIFFPIRFLWAMEANEQRLFKLPALGRSGYHPEKLLRLWQRALIDDDYRRELEREGAQFDFEQKAVKLAVGWIYIGERFVEDLLEVEAVFGVELLFPADTGDEPAPAFQAIKQLRSNKRQNP